MTIEGDEGLWVTLLVARCLLGSLNLILEDFLCFGHMENCQILQELGCHSFDAIYYSTETCISVWTGYPSQRWTKWALPYFKWDPK